MSSTEKPRRPFRDLEAARQYLCGRFPLPEGKWPCIHCAADRQLHVLPAGYQRCRICGGKGLGSQAEVLAWYRARIRRYAEDIRQWDIARAREREESKHAAHVARLAEQKGKRKKKRCVAVKGDRAGRGSIKYPPCGNNGSHGERADQAKPLTAAKDERCSLSGQIGGGTFVLRFGIHKGETVAQIDRKDRQYLDWLLEQAWLLKNVCRAIRNYRTGRPSTRVLPRMPDAAFQPEQSDLKPPWV